MDPKIGSPFCSLLLGSGKRKAPLRAEEVAAGEVGQAVSLIELLPPFEIFP